MRALDQDGDERDPEGTEVVRRDQLKIRVRLLIGRQDRIAFDAHPAIRRPGQRRFGQ